MSTVLQFLFKGTLFIAFFWVTDTGLTMGVPTSFIICHAEASKSCVSGGAVLVVARHLAITSHQLNKASVLLWLSVLQEAPCPLYIHDPPVIEDPA